MPRVAKKAAQTKTQVVTSYAELEKGLLSTKSELIKQSEKSLTTLTAQATKLKDKLAKAQSKKKTAKDKRVTAVTKAKKKPSTTAQAQLEKAKQAYDVASTAVDEIKAEFENVKTQLNGVKTAHAKFRSLAKTIDKFNAAWDKKQAVVAKPTKRRKKSKVAKKTAEVNLQDNSADVA